MGCAWVWREISHPLSGPVREGGRDFKSRRPDELTRSARAGWLLEHSPRPEMGTISGDILKAPGFLKGPAGPLSRAPRLGSSGGFFGFFASRPQNTARCKNQREALVPLFTAPEPGPLGGPPIFSQKGTFRNRPEARASRFHLSLLGIKILPVEFVEFQVIAARGAAQQKIPLVLPCRQLGAGGFFFGGVGPVQVHRHHRPLL